MARRSRQQPSPAPAVEPPALDPPDVDLNQVVAYNFRAARELRGWTQDELAERLEPYLGQRLTQAGVSSIERAWDGDRRREFDAHELLIFAMVFDLPIIWFLLPPPNDHRLMRATTRPVDELYMHLLGRPDQLEPVYARLREIGVTDPTAAETTVEKITGSPSDARQWSYRERRKELLLALLDEHTDSLDNAVEELGRWVDHLRQVGIRGFIAEHTNDEDFIDSDLRRTPASDEAARGTAGQRGRANGRCHRTLSKRDRGRETDHDGEAAVRQRPEASERTLASQIPHGRRASGRARHERSRRNTTRRAGFRASRPTRPAVCGSTRPPVGFDSPTTRPHG